MYRQSIVAATLSLRPIDPDFRGLSTFGANRKKETVELPDEK
jgi:hypothetical protein